MFGGSHPFHERNQDDSRRHWTWVPKLTDIFIESFGAGLQSSLFPPCSMFKSHIHHVLDLYVFEGNSWALMFAPLDWR